MPRDLKQALSAPELCAQGVSDTRCSSDEDFLRAVFGAEWEQAHVCAFTGDPGTPDGGNGAWLGTKWGRLAPAARVRMAARCNTYFAISIFEDDPETGRALRRKALFRETRVVVVDDVGTKVDGGLVRARMGSGSYELETSPGNFQWGYVLDPPERDAARVNALLDGMIARGLCADGRDPGMKGVTRYARLPFGWNLKPKWGAGGFKCRLREWRL